MKKNLKLFAVPTIYALAIFVFVTSMYLLERVVNNHQFESGENMEYVDKEIVTDNEYIPVIAPETTILKPFINASVTKSKSFYNYQADKNEQIDSIILYKDTYMQNSGTDYKYSESFEIVSILDGTVIEVTENDILGKTIKIKHNNDLISTYQSLSSIDVKVDDTILRGQKIGMSGTCSLYSTDYNLHFELSHLGKLIDPELSYNKTIDEL